MHNFVSSLNPFNYGKSDTPKSTAGYEDFENYNYYQFMAVPHKQSFTIVPGDPTNIYSPTASQEVDTDNIYLPIAPQEVHSGPHFSPMVPSDNFAANPGQLSEKYPASVKSPPISVGVTPTAFEIQSNLSTS